MTKSIEQLAEELAEKILLNVYVHDKDVQWGVDFPNAIKIASDFIKECRQSTRDDALEEAAKTCSNIYSRCEVVSRNVATNCAYSIRALKTNPRSEPSLGASDHAGQVQNSQATPTEDTYLDKDCIKIHKSVISFLCGEKDLNGVWFDEENDLQFNCKPPKRYWWRQYLRPFIAKNSTVSRTLAADTSIVDTSNGMLLPELPDRVVLNELLMYGSTHYFCSLTRLTDAMTINVLGLTPRAAVLAAIAAIGAK